MGDYWQKVLDGASDPWAVIGFTGQVLFGLRFLAQWIASERAGKVVVPVLFWYLSILGTVLSMMYAFKIANAVFMSATVIQALLQMPIYVRNLILHVRDRRSA